MSIETEIKQLKEAASRQWADPWVYTNGKEALPRRIAMPVGYFCERCTKRTCKLCRYAFHKSLDMAAQTSDSVPYFSILSPRWDDLITIGPGDFRTVLRQAL